jgi:hypothetical protein
MWSVEPDMNLLVPQQPSHSVPLDMMQSVCAPIYEQMYYHATSNADIYRDMNGLVSRESTQTMCAPFFEQMISALQESLHCQHSTSQQEMFRKGSTTHWDDASTDADDVCAFASLLSSSGPSEGSEPASDVEKTIQVCRHWKSKGWCRMGSNCKFSHPENKCGISAASGHRDEDGSKHIESAAAGVLSGRKKKRGGKSRSNKRQAEEEALAGCAAQEYDECFPCLSIA